jgi:superfamily II DNA or RNA helicase
MRKVPSPSGLPAHGMPFQEFGYFSKRLESYQRRVVKFALTKKTVGIFAEQGTGKTWISLALVERIALSDFAGLLIVPKNNKETTWMDLLPQLGFGFTDDWEVFKKLSGPRIFVIHHDILHKHITKLIRFGARWKCIIVDEIHRAKARGSRLSRSIARLRKFGDYRIGLSGTPLEDEPQDAWAQMRFINQDVFGTKWKRFSKRYLMATGYKGYKKKFMETKLPKFLRLMKPWAIRIEKDVLNLKPILVEEHFLTMAPRQRDVYRQMRSKSLIKVNGKVIVRAPLKITRDMKLAQIAAGHLQTEEGHYWLSNVKLRRIRAIVKRCHKPFVIFVRFVPEMEALIRYLKGFKLARYSGKVKNKPQIQRDFQAGKLDGLICQMRAGNAGIDLFNARTVIVPSFEWSSIVFDQMMARAHRRGQVHQLEAHFLVMQKTIDARTYKRIHSKLSKTRSTLYQFRRNPDHERI